MADELPSKSESDRALRQQVQKALKQVALAAGQTVIVARGPQVVAHRGDLKLTEAQDVADHVAEGWQDRGQTARVQFMRLPLLADERLLYTQALTNGYLLTVTESADVPLSQLQQAGEPASAVAGAHGLNPL